MAGETIKITAPAGGKVGAGPVRLDTRARVVIEPHKTTNASRREITADVLGVQTFHDITGRGGYTVSLFPRIEYLQYRPDDWVSVYLMRDGVEELVSWGPLNSVGRRKFSGPGGAVMTRVQLRGELYTKALMHTDILFDPQWYKVLQGINQNMMSLLDNTVFQGLKTAGDFVNFLVKNLCGTFNQFLHPTIGSLSKAISTETLGSPYTGVNTDIGGTVLTSELLSTTGTLWDALHYFSDPVNNVLFASMRRQTGGPIDNGWEPYLTLDRWPYDDDALSELPAARVRTSEVVDENLCYQDGDAKNWFRLHPQFFSAAGLDDAFQLSEGAWINEASITRHGIRRFEQAAPFCTAYNSADTKDTTSKATIDKVTADQLRRIARWYSKNEYLMSGSVTSLLKPHFRPLMRFEERHEETGEVVKGLVQSVSHMWSYFPPQSYTTAQVVRAQSSQVDSGYYTFEAQTMKRVTMAGVAEVDAPTEEIP